MNSMRRPGVFSWQHIGRSYQAFSALCDAADWANILAGTAEAIALTSKSHVRVLDVGAGTGLSAECIRRHLYGSHGITSDWNLVDPDPIVRDLQPVLMPSA